MYPFYPPSSTRAQRFLRGLTLLLILITMCLQFEAAHAQAHYARPYTGGGRTTSRAARATPSAPCIWSIPSAAIP